MLYVTNAKKMITPGSPGYSLNRILFAPKNDQEKRNGRCRFVSVRNVSRLYGSDPRRVVSPISGSSVSGMDVFGIVGLRMVSGVRSGG